MNALGLSFARPSALWLLLAVPLVLALGLIFGVRKGRVPQAALLLRLATVTLLAVALAEPLVAQGDSSSNTIFVVDRSRSVGPMNDGPINAWLSDALDSAGNGDRAAIITFAGEPELAAQIGPASAIDRDLPAPAGEAGENFTDIESALALARTLPVGGSRRIVLVSDGAENLGSALNQVGQAATDGTPIDILPLTGVGGDDVRVEGVSAPGTVWIGEPVNVLASVASGSGGDAMLDVIVDGVSLGAKPVTLDPGLKTFPVKIPPMVAGFHEIAVHIQPVSASDIYAENNTAPLAVVVRDAPRLLLVSELGSDPGTLRKALESKGAVITETQPNDLSTRRSDYGQYDAVLLFNIPGSSLTIDQMKALQEVTRGLGKGLVVIGGRESYGPGDYAGTVLEETLPVTVKVTDGRQRQRVALLLIIDKSGSMSYDPSGQVSKIDMAKEAARIATQALTDGDQVGILVFSDSQQWVQRIVTLDGQATRDQINSAIDAIEADGGTEIYPALQLGFDAIRNTDADVRHIVLLTDGKSRTGTSDSYEKLITDAISDRTTLSTIAIGDDADTDLLQELARWGNGRYHFAEKPEDIPRLTLQEAQGVGSQSIIEGDFPLIYESPSPIMEGFDITELPHLNGYDYAEPRPDAQVVLKSTREDPILAKWQLGLGRVVAWTADAGADFAEQWPTWDRYADFWSSLVRWALPDPESQAIDVSTERDGQDVVVTLTAAGDDNQNADLSQLAIATTGPDGSQTQGIKTYQSGPGEFQFRVKASQEGAYEISMTRTEEGKSVTELAGFTMPSSPELQPSPDSGALMQVAAARTGGRVLSLDDAGEVFAVAGSSGAALRNYHQVWFIPLTAALALLLVELAIRLSFIDRLRGILPRR